MSVDKGIFRPPLRTVGFSLRFKNSGHVLTFLRRCGLQNTDHVMPFWLFPLKVDCLGAFHYAKPTGQRSVGIPEENGTTFPIKQGQPIGMALATFYSYSGIS